MKTIITILVTISVSFLSNGQSYFNENFDSPTYKVKLGTEKNNLWQVGTSQKNFVLNSNPFLYGKYIITDSIKPYKRNNTSSFTISIPTIYNGSFVQLSFHHALNSDTLKDGGFLDVSYDGEKTWNNLLTDTMANIKPWTSNHIYSKTDTIQGKIPAFSGNIKPTQVNVSFDNLNKYNVKQLSVRFTFKSDKDSSQKGGWAIDFLSLSSAIVEGIDKTESENNRHLSIYPHPANGSSVLKTNNIGSAAVLLIYTIEGVLIKELSIKEGAHYQISSLGLAAGFYTYRLNSLEKLIENGKLVIE